MLQRSQIIIMTLITIIELNTQLIYCDYMQIYTHIILGNYSVRLIAHNFGATAKISCYFLPQFCFAIAPRYVTNERNEWRGYRMQWNIEVAYSRCNIHTYNAYSILWRQRHVYTRQAILVYRSALRRVVAFGINIGQYLSRAERLNSSKYAFAAPPWHDTWKIANTNVQLSWDNQQNI